jgi:hypothetical protein
LEIKSEFQEKAKTEYTTENKFISKKNWIQDLYL